MLKQRLKLIFHQFILILILMTILKNPITDIMDLNHLYSLIFLEVVLLILFQLFYNKAEKIKRNGLIVIISLIGLMFILLLIYSTNTDSLFHLTQFIFFLILLIYFLIFLLLDVFLFNIRFSKGDPTNFERLFLWSLITLGVLTVFSLFPENQKILETTASSIKTNIIDKYGSQATMLSLIFGFILFYITELRNRKNDEKEQNHLDPSLLDQLKKINKQIDEQNKTIRSLVIANKNLEKKLSRTEKGVKEHMNIKTAQIIRKTK